MTKATAVIKELSIRMFLGIRAKNLIRNLLKRIKSKKNGAENSAAIIKEF